MEIPQMILKWFICSFMQAKVIMGVLEWFCKERNWRIYVKMIMEYFKVKWICKVMRRYTLYYMILRNDFRWGFMWKEMEKQKHCGCELAENMGHFANQLVRISKAKNSIFRRWIDQLVIFQIVSESLHSKVCGKRYGRFAKTGQDRPKLCTVVF